MFISLPHSPPEGAELPPFFSLSPPPRLTDSAARCDRYLPGSFASASKGQTDGRAQADRRAQADGRAGWLRRAAEMECINPKETREPI